jgi:hypothetical protein
VSAVANMFGFLTVFPDYLNLLCMIIIFSIWRLH